MTKILSKFLAVVLLLSALFLLFSCGGEIVKEGIDISDDKPVFSEQTEQKSKEVFYSLLEGAYILGGMPSVPEQKAKELQELSDRIWEITSDYHISEAQYNRIIDEITKNKNKFISLISGKTRGIEELKDVYYSLTSGGGPDYAGYAFYNLLVFGMDYKYGQQMERYEKYGYAYLVDEANEIKEQKITLESEIGLDNFSLATRVLVMGAELFFGGAFDGTAADGFSNREILVILQRIDVESIKVSEKGYKFLLSLAVPESVNEESSFADCVFFCADDNGDLDKIASAANDFLRLFVSMQGKLSDRDAELLKNGEFSELLYSSFSDFDAEDWELFEKITAIELDFDSYEGLFSENYGEDFEKYSSECAPESLDALKDAVGSEEFLIKLEGYLAGISPVLSYCLFK